MYHQPVLVSESVGGLNIRSDGVYVDLTYGGGGHSAEILKSLKKGRLYAFDVDREAEEQAIRDKRFTFIRGNFRHVKNFLRYQGVSAIDGALADLGVSSHHLDVSARGFSYRFNSQLDMRMNREAGKTAADVLNQAGIEDLQRIFASYGELKDALRLSRQIIRAREQGSLRTVKDLVQGVENCIPKRNRNKYLSKVFQAIRIEVNDEINALKEMMEGITGLLTEGGRFCVISYHSLEDRLVKNYFRSGNLNGRITRDLFGNARLPYRLVNRGVITPQPGELESNKRARSAKLRIAERIKT